MSKRVQETAVGIDLGTTYSCVAVWLDQHNRVEIIPNQQGNRITPSCVAWDGTQFLIGEAAKNQISRNPTRTVFAETLQAVPVIGQKENRPLNTAGLENRKVGAAMDIQRLR
ncbi:heat shock protein 70 family [Artemisia annua]|uniref:Heat shock protein 70 family n=1 Tax=Artemisia annua TaxID=35608 RepID=A0A2U1QH83_ARTAN|nr:heat shock protein 70 family [Artemisia annua]